MFSLTDSNPVLSHSRPAPQDPSWSLRATVGFVYGSLNHQDLRGPPSGE